jgi:hypothetical protein
MTKGSPLEVSFEDLTGAGIMTKAGFKAVHRRDDEPAWHRASTRNSSTVAYPSIASR